MTTEVKKYELLKNDTVTRLDGQTLYRIRALVNIPDVVKAGDLGGYVESENSLSHEDNAWVSGNAWVSDNARVSGDAWVSGDARVSDDAWVSGRNSIVWFSNVGREYGTLTCYRGKDNTLLVTRGCFSGTEAQFLAAVDETHGASQIGHEYRLLIELARSCLGFAAPVAAQGE